MIRKQTLSRTPRLRPSQTMDVALLQKLLFSPGPKFTPVMTPADALGLPPATRRTQGGI